jgi:type VI secretion system secreted protein VgrG
MGKYTQDSRQMSINTPLGKDILLLAGFQGTEAISRLFSFELDLLSENNTISFEDIIGKRVLITVQLPKGKRYFQGMICRFSQAAGQEADGRLRLSQYRATMVPWTWLLTRTSDARIYQNLSVPEIVEKIFKEKGFSDFSMEVQEQHDKREFCVQYRETDFNFISRLMEAEGIYYYFTHDQNTHTMVIADTPGKHKKLPSSVRHYRVSGVPVGEDTISTLEKFQEVQAGKYTLNEFNFEIPNTSLKASVDSQQKLGPGEREMYDFPGGYAAKAAGDKLARIRMEEEEARITTIRGSGNCREFTSGFRFTLTNAYRPDISDKEYLLTSVEHKAAQGWEGDSEVDYQNSFTCIPFTVPFRPPLATLKPCIHGSQTAIVVGKKGDEIYTDKYGRIKVQFHWDREGKKDENASCWMRVGQIWAGQGWGSVWIPRVGHEVIVSFMEGDPDQPLITGSVYDGTNMPPYPLPADMNKSTIKSNSTKGGGGFNELRFDDTKGAEEVYLQGEKNWNILIKNDKSQTIGHDETLSVGNNRTKDVTKDQSESIGQNKSINVGKDHTESIGGNATIDVAKDKSLTIGGNSTLTISKDSTEQIQGKLDTSVAKEMSITVGKDSTTQVSGNMGISVDKKLSIQATDSISISSDKEIVLKAGDASITLKSRGIS